MTITPAPVSRPGRRELGRSLAASGALAEDWKGTYEAVDRVQFLPHVIWPWDMADRQSVCIDKNVDPDAWYAAADTDQPIVTQWDDGRHTGTEPGSRATSSSSMPSVVYRLLGDLDVHEHMNVLDAGTGTGETAAALAHRCGPDNVVTVDVDAAVSQHAEQRLYAAGLQPTVVVGDGSIGYRPRAPYDRALVTFGLRAIPGGLIEQTRSGGLIVAPWGTHFSNAEAVARLTVTNGTAEGHFTAGVEFMKSRAQLRPPIVPSDYVPPEGVGSAVQSTTGITEEEFAGGRFEILPWVLGLRVRGCVQAVAERRGNARPVWFYSLTDRSWAVVMLRDEQTESRVWQSGPRRLWDEVEAAYHWWRGEGEPSYERFGLTVTPEGGPRAWLDAPSNCWPV
ncbi:protein-L-isoaspartate O-methyltransferase family protein [Streptomyces sp. NRRL S-1448]|uniref:protein-L-isoaspartate O-methyltransferase family protein n=1 Tax=Streptomyces sp. NRRL S-1448 TaxID=1463883 RepID=UPI0004BFFC34|nr:methyltransferase domain-containing protein [Streptomyces sp. NRRL S-1448]